MAVQQWVKDLTAKIVGESIMAVGKELQHPDGRTVVITGGQYWGKYGVSNFWYWREKLPNGKLSTKEEHGYGWC